MARQKTIYVTGAIEHLIFYEFRGKPCCRMRPAKVKQTPATRAASQLFGQAARMSRILRIQLTPLLPDPKDKEMMYRLNKVLLQWLRTGPDHYTEYAHRLFEGFTFNAETELSSRFRLSFTIDWTDPKQVIVHIPELVPTKDVAAPASTQILHWQMAVVSSQLTEKAAIQNAQITSWNIPYTDEVMPAQQVVLPFEQRPDEIIVVAASLRYSTVRKGAPEIITDKKWLPAGVIGCCYKPV